MRTFKNATQIKVDVFYDEISEVYAFINHIHGIIKSERYKSEQFDLGIPIQDVYGIKDMTEYYKKTNEVTGEN